MVKEVLQAKENYKRRNLGTAEEKTHTKQKMSKYNSLPFSSEFSKLLLTVEAKILTLLWL